MSTDIAMRTHPLFESDGVRADDARPRSNVDWRQALAGALLVAGLVAILVAWYGISGTLDPGEQMPYLISGGVGGAALIAFGVTLLVAYEHARDRAALDRLLDRIDQLERRLEERDANAPGNGNGNGAAKPARAGRRTTRS
ncbi:MAG TPA: hypothetical protein VJ777_18430 [Mycobacterium sp.]|jgi:hypothetical protein|nr:hypothetical protein [Mycobacterium sp.]